MAFGMGIDVGTTFTGACVAAADGVRIVELAQRTAAMPTVVHVAADGTLTIGEPAERRAVAEPERIIRAFKRRFGDPTPILVGAAPWSADAMTSMVLAHVLRTVSAEQGAPPSAVVVTHPANWGAYKLDLLASAARAAGISTPHLCPEPVAAAISYSSEDRVVEGEIIGVYDFGGGTFDSAVLQKVAGGFEMLGRPDGLERLGGIDLDEVVFALVRAGVSEPGAFDVDELATRGALARIRRDCVEAKEALATEQVVSIPVLLPGLSATVRLTRGELEASARPLIERTVEMMVRTVAAAGLGPGDIHRLLLVGGSSRMPLVGELLGRVFPTVVRDANPKQVVARGAALLALRDLAPARPPAWPTPSPAPTPVPVPPMAVPPAVPPASPPQPPRRRRWAIPAGIAMAGLVAAGIGAAAARSSGGSGDSTTTTTEDSPVTSTGPPVDSPFLFAERPVEGESGPLAGLRGTNLFTEVDSELSARLLDVDSEYPGTSGPAEAYDAVVAAALAVAASGTDGSPMASAIAEVTDGGAVCRAPAECLSAIGEGDDVAYIGLSGPTTMDPSGNRVAAETVIVEFDARGRLASEVAATATFGPALDFADSPPNQRPGDGVLQVAVVHDVEPSDFERSTRAAARLAVADLNEAGGVLGAPVELTEIAAAGGAEGALPDLVDATIDVVVLIERDTDDARTTAALADLGITVVDPGGQHPLLVDRDDNGFYFSFGHGAFIEVATLTRSVVDHASGPVAIVVGEETFTRVTADFLLDDLAAADVDVVADVEWDGSRATVDEVADEIADVEPATVIVLSGSVSVAPVIEALTAAGMGPTDVFVYVDSFAVLNGRIVDELS